RLRHQAVFHAARRADKQYLGAVARLEFASNGEGRNHMSAGAATGNENAHDINVVCNVADWERRHKSEGWLCANEMHMFFVAPSACHPDRSATKTSTFQKALKRGVEG